MLRTSGGFVNYPLIQRLNEGVTCSALNGTRSGSSYVSAATNINQKPKKKSLRKLKSWFIPQPIGMKYLA